MRPNSMLKLCRVLSSRRTPPLTSSMACSSIPDMGSSPGPSPAWVWQIKQTLSIIIGKSFIIILNWICISIYTVGSSIVYEDWNWGITWPDEGPQLFQHNIQSKKYAHIDFSHPSLFLVCSAWFLMARFFAWCIISLKDIVKALVAGHTQPRLTCLLDSPWMVFYDPFPTQCGLWFQKCFTMGNTVFKFLSEIRMREGLNNHWWSNRIK